MVCIATNIVAIGLLGALNTINQYFFQMIESQPEPFPLVFEEQRGDFITRLELYPRQLKIYLFDIPTFEIYLQEINSEYLSEHGFKGYLDDPQHLFNYFKASFDTIAITADRQFNFEIEIVRVLNIRKEFTITTYKKGAREIDELQQLQLSQQQLVKAIEDQKQAIRNHEQNQDRLTKENRQLHRMLEKIEQASKQLKSESWIEMAQQHPSQHLNASIKTTTTLDQESCCTTIKVVKVAEGSHLPRFVSSESIKENTRYILDLKRCTARGLMVGIASKDYFSSSINNNKDGISYNLTKQLLCSEGKTEERRSDEWGWWRNKVVLDIDLQCKVFGCWLNQNMVCDTNLTQTMLQKQLYIFIELTHKGDEVALQVEHSQKE